MDPNENRIRNLEAQLKYLTESAKKLQTMMYEMGAALRTMHELHMKELKACQQSFQQNKDACEELEDAIMASCSDPWG